MPAFATAVAAGALLVLAYPPVGWEVLAVPAVAAFLVALRWSPSRGAASVVGLGFGLAFFGLLFTWIGELGLVALIPLLLSQAAFPALFGAAIWSPAPRSEGAWLVAVAGAWGLMEAIRARFPVGGFGWGMLGYPAGELEATRNATHLIGTSGWSVVLAGAAAGLAVVFLRRRPVYLAATAPIALLALVGLAFPPITDGNEVRVAVIQGSSPCPGTHCPNEREQIFQTHLELTRTLEPGTYDLVVWPEGSSGGLSADPIRNPAAGEAIAAEARRLGAAFLVGSDRPISDTHWVNVNVVWNEEGEVLGEYPKRHPVPFGEYIPARSLFDWIPALSQVPRDMIPGEDPVVFDLPFSDLGSVISFESQFARYPREEVQAGADLLVVATSQASYPYSRASDQLIGITRMRAAELGVDIVHSSVSGRSTLITDGGYLGDVTPLSEPAILTGTVETRAAGPTLYTIAGDWLQAAAVLAWAGLAAGRRLRARRSEGLLVDEVLERLPPSQR